MANCVKVYYILHTQTSREYDVEYNDGPYEIFSAYVGGMWTDFNLAKRSLMAYVNDIRSRDGYEETVQQETLSPYHYEISYVNGNKEKFDLNSKLVPLPEIPE